MVVRPKLRDETAEQLEEIKEKHEYGSLDEAINHALRERDDNVIVAYDGSKPSRAFTSWEKGHTWQDYWTEKGLKTDCELVEVLVNDTPPENDQ